MRQLILPSAAAIVLSFLPAWASAQAASGHEGHDMSAMNSMPAREHEMKSVLGPYSMTRDGSGTSWQPDATPMMGLHVKQGDWSVMAHGLVAVVYDK